VLVVEVSIQKSLAMTDLSKPGHFAYFQKAAVNQVECYEGLPVEQNSLLVVVSMRAMIIAPA
jgi:hypothetical protein